jgi:hypothetical protein
MPEEAKARMVTDDLGRQPRWRFFDNQQVPPM